MELRNLKQNLIGLYEKALPNSMSWENKIKCAKKAGFDFIELSIDESDERLNRLDWTDEQIKEIKQLLADSDMTFLSMCLSGHRRFPFGSHDIDKRNMAFEITDKAFLLAQKLGIRNIQLAGYDVYYEKSDEDTLSRFIKGLHYVAQKAEHYNIMASIEIMDTEFMGTITRCLSYIDLINSPYLQIYPDLGNLSRWTDDPAEELKLGKHHIVAIHLKDTKPNVFKCVPFGDGTVDFIGLFKTISALPYFGPFVIEMWADNTLSETFESCLNRINEAKLWLYERM